MWTSLKWSQMPSWVWTPDCRTELMVIQHLDLTLSKVLRRGDGITDGVFGEVRGALTALPLLRCYLCSVRADSVTSREELISQMPRCTHRPPRMMWGEHPRLWPGVQSSRASSALYGYVTWNNSRHHSWSPNRSPEQCSAFLKQCWVLTSVKSSLEHQNQDSLEWQEMEQNWKDHVHRMFVETYIVVMYAQWLVMINVFLIVCHTQKCLKPPGIVSEGRKCRVRWPGFESGSATC